jgi:hypothetical protein
MSRARERRIVDNRRDLEAMDAPYSLEELPELSLPGARLCFDRWYDDLRVYIWWTTQETDEEWAARLAKLDAQAARRAVSAGKRKLADEKQRQEQEAADRALFESLKKKHGW